MNYSLTYQSTSFPDAKPFTGVVENTVSALRLVQAAQMGIIPRIVRRLNDSERQRLLVPGAILVFSVEESGIKRWTDGRLWSPSRIAGNFLVYKEMHEKPGSRNQRSRGHPENSPRCGDIIRWDADANRPRYEPSRPTSSSALNGTLKTGGLIKKTITVTMKGTDFHLISYYTQEDVMTGRLKRLSTRPDVANLILEPRNFCLGSFRNPPKVMEGPDGKSMIAPEAEDVEPQEYLKDALLHRATGSPKYHTGAMGMTPSSAAVTTFGSHQSVHLEGSSTTSLSPGNSPGWREEYESVSTVDLYRQGTNWETTPSSAETHSMARWPSESALPPTPYGNPLNPTAQQTQPQAHSTVDLLEWPTSAQRHEFEFPASDTSPVLSTTASSKTDHPHLTLPSAREMYADGHWSANTSPTHEYTVSPLQQRGAQALLGPGQPYYAYRTPVLEGAGHHYKVNGYENDRFLPR